MLNPFLESSTPSQKDALKYTCDLGPDERGFVYWMGGVRSGKSFGSVMCLLEHMKSRTNKTYMVLCYTQSQGLTIFGREIEKQCDAMNIECKINRSVSNPRVVFKDTKNEILFKGADKIGRDRNIQGLTLDGLIADEIPLLNKDALHQAEARVSGTGALRIYTSNKTTPYHWTTKYYVNRLEKKEIKGLLLDSQIEDNPNVDSSYAKERRSEYDGVTLSRFMDNEFTLDSPPIYNPEVTSKINKYFIEPKPTKLALVYGHAKGFDIIHCYVNYKKKKVCVYETASYGSKATLDIKKLNYTKFVLLNTQQFVLLRQLRHMDIKVKGYKPIYSDRKCNVLRKACLDKNVVIYEKSNLVEPLNVYSQPGNYVFPCLNAFEALSLIVYPFIDY